MSLSLLFFSIVLFRTTAPVLSQGCSLPDESSINTALMQLLTSVGGEGGVFTTTLINHTFTCLAVARRDQYRSVSVAVSYSNSARTGEFTAQFPLQCVSNTFSVTSEFDQSPPANAFSIATRRDCRTCTTLAPPDTDTTADCVCES